MQKMSNGDYFDEKMRRGDRSKEARRISPPLKLLLKSPKLRGSTAPKSAHLHRGREQGDMEGQTALGLAAAMFEASPKNHPDLHVLVCEILARKSGRVKFLTNFLSCYCSSNLSEKHFTQYSPLSCSNLGASKQEG